MLYALFYLVDTLLLDIRLTIVIKRTVKSICTRVPASKAHISLRRVVCCVFRELTLRCAGIDFRFQLVGRGPRTSCRFVSLDKVIYYFLAVRISSHQNGRDGPKVIHVCSAMLHYVPRTYARPVGGRCGWWLVGFLWNRRPQHEYNYCIHDKNGRISIIARIEPRVVAGTRPVLDRDSDFGRRRVLSLNGTELNERFCRARQK